AGGQHGRTWPRRPGNRRGTAAVPVGIARIRIRHADCTVRPSGFPSRRVYAGDAGELVRAIVWRRLQLIQVVPAVIALELGIVWERNWSAAGAVQDVGVLVEPH